MGAWYELRRRYPWPDVKPDVYEHPNKGWLSDGTKEMLLDTIRPGDDVLEMGAFTGLSARFVLDNVADTRIVCVDAWAEEPSLTIKEPERLWPIFQDLFYQRCWGYRDRIVAIKDCFACAVPTVQFSNWVPSKVYIDGAHDAASVECDIVMAVRAFPQATLIGDDWKMKSVQAGVKAAIAKVRQPDWNILLDLHHNERAWRLSCES